MQKRASIDPSHRHLARRVLALSLLAALVDAYAAANPLPADIPLQWPLAHERAAQTTPLRARLDALRISRPAPAGSQSRVLTVSNCADDDSSGSLRNAVELALSGDTIDLSHLVCSTISLSQGALKVELDDLTLLGPGADQLTLDAGGRDRILLNPGSGTLTIAGLTLGFLTWQVAFMSVGGEWFGMWMSKQWNGVPDAFRFFITLLIVLIYLTMDNDALPEQQEAAKR